MTQQSRKANVEKRKPKGEIKFQVSLNDEQKEAKKLILENPITVLKGMAGSGKTLVAAQAGLDMLFKREVERIVVTRPMVSSSTDIGTLPGGMDLKCHPWLMPIYSNLYSLYHKDKIDEMLMEGVIEILPLQFMRGRTLTNSFIIVDECQNLTNSETQMTIGRLGKNSRMVFTGDTSQIDLKNKKDSGIEFFKILEVRTNCIKIFNLKENHRHSAVKDILNVYKEYDM